MNTNALTEPVTKKTPEFDPYQNEETDNASPKTPDIFPDADADDTEIDLERGLPAEGAGMRDGGLTGSIEPDR